MSRKFQLALGLSQRVAPFARPSPRSRVPASSSCPLASVAILLRLRHGVRRPRHAVPRLQRSHQLTRQGGKTWPWNDLRRERPSSDSAHRARRAGLRNPVGSDAVELDCHFYASCDREGAALVCCGARFRCVSVYSDCGIPRSLFVLTYSRSRTSSSFGRVPQGVTAPRDTDIRARRHGGPGGGDVPIHTGQERRWGSHEGLFLRQPRPPEVSVNPCYTV